MTWPRRYHEMCIGLQFKKNMLYKSSYLKIWLCTEVCMKRNLIISYHLTIICLRCNSKWLTLEKHIIRLKIFYYDWMQVSHWLKDFTQQLSLYTSDTFTQLWEYFLTQRSYLCKKIEYNDFFNTLLTKQKVLDWEHFSGFTRSSFREVILYTSATARWSGPTLNSINAKSQTSANKSWKHEVRITLWVSSLWVCSK